jgi:hypothetical protein
MDCSIMNTQAAVMPLMQARVHDMDRVRIERALRQRVRYRYVQPQVERAEDTDTADSGWVITSPCCSRNIDPTGGVIPIAWVEPVEGAWALYFRDHVHDSWVLHDESRHLQPLLDEICLDPMRVFWP